MSLVLRPSSVTPDVSDMVYAALLDVGGVVDQKLEINDIKNSGCVWINPLVLINTVNIKANNTDQLTSSPPIRVLRILRERRIALFSSHNTNFGISCIEEFSIE